MQPNYPQIFPLCRPHSPRTWRSARRLDVSDSRRGFSLLELLIAMSLLSIVGMAIFGNLNSGIKIWKVVQRPSPQEEMSLFFQKTLRDLHQAFKYTGLPFEGSQNRMSFVTSIHTDPELGGDRGIGRVTYFYSRRDKRIMKETQNLNHIYKEKSGLTQRLLGDVTSFDLSFFVLDPEAEEYHWVKEWEDEEALPVAVRMKFRTLWVDEEQTFTKTFMIPAGGLT